MDRDTPVATDEDFYEEYVVEAIHDERVYQKKRQYLIEWEMFPEREDWTWEPASKLQTPEGEPYHALQDFLARKARKVGQKRHISDTANRSPKRRRRR